MLFQLIEKKIRSNMKFFIYLQKEKCKKKKTEKQKYKFLLGNYIPTASLRVQTSHKCTCERKCIRTHT